MTSDSVAYTGRFAPSPTGPLHFGSLLAATASYAQALVNGGRWLLRIEDLDPPREQPGSDRLIIDALELYGFQWDGPVTYQSAFRVRHEELLTELIESGKAYRCACSRRDLADVRRGNMGAIYPGTCRNQLVVGEAAVRLRVNDEPIEFIDALQGPYQQKLESESGDFVIRRRDGLIAYHLAVVADDFDQEISEVVRGIDLLDSTPRQIHLQRQLGLATPQYMHIPVAVDAKGEKLSKRTGAAAISADNAESTLWLTLDCLNQQPPNDLTNENVDTIWRWVSDHWDAARLRGKSVISASRHGYG